MHGVAAAVRFQADPEFVFAVGGPYQQPALAPSSLHAKREHQVDHPVNVLRPLLAPLVEATLIGDGHLPGWGGVAGQPPPVTIDEPVDRRGLGRRRMHEPPADALPPRARSVAAPPRRGAAGRWMVGVVNQNGKRPLLEERFPRELVVDVDLPRANLDRLAGQADHALHQHPARASRVAKRGQLPPTRSAQPVHQLVDEHPVAVNLRLPRQVVPQATTVGTHRPARHRTVVATDREAASALRANDLPVRAPQRVGHRAAGDLKGNEESFDQPGPKHQGGRDQQHEPPEARPPRARRTGHLACSNHRSAAGLGPGTPRKTPRPRPRAVDRYPPPSGARANAS